jgi:RNA polymerase sigma-70 factor (ECF subfamily)
VPTNPKPASAVPQDADHAVASDEELVGRAGQGCAWSFEELCRRYQVPLLEWFRFRRHAADSEDLLQETLLRVYRNLHRYDPRWRFATWLFVIARRVSINHHQRFLVPADSEALESVPSPTRDPVQIAAENETRTQLWDVVRQVLTDEEAMALWLHYVEDLPTHEIAAVLGRSRVSVKTMMFRARKKLRPHLRQADVAGPADEAADSADRP